MTQRIIEITSPRYIPVEKLPTELSSDFLFGEELPVALEIGCGTGHFVADMAEKHQETGFIAIDIYNRGCYKTCRKADNRVLDNVRVLRMEARDLLRHLPKNFLSAVYVNCPDPWPKKRHRKRRLVNEDLLEQLRYVLKPGGHFYFVSDFGDYTEVVEMLLGREPGWQTVTTRRIEQPPEDYPVSKYMRRFLDKGEPLYYVQGCREPGDRLSGRPPEKPRRGFRLPWGKLAHG